MHDVKLKTKGQWEGIELQKMKLHNTNNTWQPIDNNLDTADNREHAQAEKIDMLADSQT